MICLKMLLAIVHLFTRSEAFWTATGSPITATDSYQPSPGLGWGWTEPPCVNSNHALCCTQLNSGLLSEFFI